MKILIISQSFMAPKLGPTENNYGGTEAFINNFCLAYHKEHQITVYSMLDAVNNIPGVNLVHCGNYSRAYLEQQSGKKERCNNGGLVALINQHEDLSYYDLIIDNTCNKTIYQALERRLHRISEESADMQPLPKVYSIAHSRPSYAGRGVDEAVKNMDQCHYVKFISVTESATQEWNKFANKVVGHDVMAGSFGLRVLDKLEGNPLKFNYDDPKGIIVARIDPVKNFGQFNQISDKTEFMEFYAWGLLIPCGQKEYDGLNLGRFTKGNLHYMLNQDVVVKEAWIKENCPMTFSTSVSENGGTTCLESMMYGLPICVVAHRENGCVKYVQDGEELYINDDFQITTHGILLAQNGHAHENFAQAMKYVIENRVFDSHAIRKYYEDNYSFNNKALEQLMKL